ALGDQLLSVFVDHTLVDEVA
uniref:GMP synthase [glutamine-hydrolyzing] (Fragments) n=1 Tax=Fructilactobacillus sanfranciscensis TaxID=1625 RepID=GUAA_FRUSA|nr:RecName: Full=GMP synthase [glutamine-hydrolyzing]; AltName: Full=GMP synthetase; AltName: Full=Glutamine amidotransferase [Fructilactobacillus sanfranciscensis]